METGASSKEATNQIPVENLVNYVGEDRIDTVSEADRGILLQAQAAFITENDSEVEPLAENDSIENCSKDGFVTLSDGTSTALDNTVVTFSYSALEAQSSEAFSDGPTESSLVTSSNVAETSKATSGGVTTETSRATSDANTETSRATSGCVTTETSKDTSDANTETSRATSGGVTTETFRDTSDANTETSKAICDTGTETQADTANTLAKSEFFQYPSINDGSSGKYWVYRVSCPFHFIKKYMGQQALQALPFFSFCISLHLFQ